MVIGHRPPCPGRRVVDLTGPMPWTALWGMFDPFVPKRNLQYYWKSIYLNSLGDDVVDFLVERAATIPCTTQVLPPDNRGGGTQCRRRVSLSSIEVRAPHYEPAGQRGDAPVEKEELEPRMCAPSRTSGRQCRHRSR